MPVYSINKTFAINTTKSASETQIIKACSGIIKQLRLFFPSGTANKTHIRILYRGQQILPSNQDTEFLGDDLVINLNLDEEILDEPATIIISGWNTDTVDTHQITGEIVIKSRERGDD